MYVRTASGQVQPGKMQEFIDIDNNEIIPFIKAQKGFQGFYAMRNVASGKILAFSVWDTEADMLAVETNGQLQQEVFAKLGSVLVGPVTIEHYELSVEASV